MDFLDFEGGELYFDKPVSGEVDRLLSQASSEGRDDSAETSLLRAYFLEPEHYTVLVALYRFYYYKQRYEDALLVADRVLVLSSQALGLAADWRSIGGPDIAQSVQVSMVMTRFFLLALKSSSFMLLRMQRIGEALERLNKLGELDPADQFGSSALIEIAASYNGSGLRIQ